MEVSTPLVSLEAGGGGGTLAAGDAGGDGVSACADVAATAKNAKTRIATTAVKQTATES
jgi:hypothetical protein